MMTEPVEPKMHSSGLEFGARFDWAPTLVGFHRPSPVACVAFHRYLPVSRAAHMPHTHHVDKERRSLHSAHAPTEPVLLSVKICNR